MKALTTVKWMAALVLGASLAANAQGTGDVKGDKGPGGGPGVPGGVHRRPTPEQMAEHLMTKFDTNKDGELSQEELTAALKELREHRPQGPQGGAAGGAVGGVAQGAQAGERPGFPPAEKAAARMIEKFSADKKGLTAAELAKAIDERRDNRPERGGEHQGGERPPAPGGASN